MQAGTAGDYLGLGWTQIRSTSTNLAPTMNIDHVAVFLRALNAPPVAYAQPDGGVVVNAFQTFTLTGSDPEDSSLTFSVVDSPAHGELTGTPPNLTYTPDTDFEGNGSFTFKANDGVLDSAPATVSILVHPNWLPVADQQGMTVAIIIPVASQCGWLAVESRRGSTYGQTDELGYNILDGDGNLLVGERQPSKHHFTRGAVHVHDLNATILHLLGIDHTKLTYRY
jgi:hypothetical protein